MASNPSKAPVGEMKKIVTLVDRVAFDEFVYPTDSPTTKFQPVQPSYHNYTQETVVWPFSGRPDWGQRITFRMPWPWQGDFLNYMALRLKPLSWIPGRVQQNISPEVGKWSITQPNDFFIWANSLGTTAIALAEMEVDGIVIESFSGDWLNVWNKTTHDVTQGLPYDDGIYNTYTPQTINSWMPSEDGYVYCYLPFWFAKYANTAFPLLSKASQDTVQFHITLRPFSEVVRKLRNPLTCNEMPQGKTIAYTNLVTNQPGTFTIPLNIPSFEQADMVCGVTHIDGELRKAYIDTPHEILMSPVVETVFNEPLKYQSTAREGNTVKVGLPLTIGNGPIRQMLFFLRRKAAIQKFNDFNNYALQLDGEADPIWNPLRPLLVKAQLLVGTAVWADEDELWWRAASDIQVPGGIRAYGNYIYGYNFADKPVDFHPSGSVNASRVDMRLNLTVIQPLGDSDSEWTVTVFLIGTNWMRFENGLANQIFMD